MSDNPALTILLIEDDFQYADHLRTILDKHSSHTFSYKRVATFAKAVKQLRSSQFDAILMDLDVEGLENLEQITDLIYHAPHTPILGLMLTNQSDMANTAAEHGLQDTIIKHQHEETLLASKILFAIKRIQAMNKNNPLAHQASQFSVLEDMMYNKKTGLPNQILFEDRLEQSIIRADRDACSTALLAINLDHFNAIKDTYGNRTSDCLLKQAAKRLSELTRDCDTVSHIDQNKFLIVLEQVGKPSETISIAERMIRTFSRTFQVNQDKVKMTISMGIAIYPKCDSVLQLIESAKLAMQRATDAGGNRYKLYTENIRKEGIWKYGLEKDLDQALKLQQFELYYQPMFDLREGIIIGVEALLRWHHPEHGTLLPGAFIEHLESSDTILDVGEWVIRQACEDLKSWYEVYPDFTMAINLAPSQLVDPHLLERLNAIITANHLSPKDIELEITARQLLDADDPICQYNIKALLERGIHLALDDFGSAYNTEAYFRNFPKNTISTLKLDVIDIQGMMIDTDTADRVQKYIQYAHSQNIRVIAEGVENEQQVLTLIEYGADIIQGFLVSEAVSNSDLEDSLRRKEFVIFENLQANEVGKPLESMPVQATERL